MENYNTILHELRKFILRNLGEDKKTILLQSYPALLMRSANTVNCENNNERIATVLELLLYMQMFSEVYVYINYLIQTKKVEDASILTLLDTMKNQERLEDMRPIFFLQDFYGYLEKAMDFENLSAYDKVLSMKALTQEDVENICKWYPFFLEEYKHFNVEVDEAFLLRQMNKWMNHCKDFKKTLQVTSDFLKDYQYIDASFMETLSQKYEDQDPEKILTMMYEASQK